MDALQEIFARLERPEDFQPTAPAEPEDVRRPFANATDAMRFMLSGHATVTFQGKTSRFTYKLTVPKIEGTEKPDHNSQIRFVALLNGPDNEGSFQYLGYIKRGVYFHGKKAKVGPDAPAARAFTWAYGNLARGKMPEGLQVWHEGRCGRCERKLTVPASIASGYGPECVNHVY